MRVWVTADTHLGHKKIIGYEPARQRFASIEEHDEFLAAQWSDRVRPQDVVYVVGDVAWNRAALDRFKNWPGIKKLILGNHDHLDTRAYLDVFRSVRAYHILGDNWLVAHIPVHASSLVPRFNGQIHGHTHGHGSPAPARMLDVGDGGVTVQVAPYRSACVELHDFAPVLLEELTA